MKKIFFPTSNGVVIHRDDKKVISATDCDGQKRVLSFRERNKIIFWLFPFARGVQFFFCGIFGFFQSLMLSFDICNSQKIKQKDINKYYTQKLIIAVIIMVLGVIFSAFVLGFLPGKIGYAIVDHTGSDILRNVVILCFKLLLFLLFIGALRVFPVVMECFRFNRAYEVLLENAWIDKQKRKNVEKQKNIKKSQKNRKKTQKNQFFAVFSQTNRDTEPNFLNYLVFVFLLDFVVVILWGVDFGFWLNLGVDIAVFVVCTSVGFEIVNFLSNSPFKIFRKLLGIMSFLVYAKPAITHLETVKVGLLELNMLCTQKEREFMNDESKKAFSMVYLQVRNKLQNVGITDKSDADWLIATVLGKNRAEIKLVPYVTEKQYQDIMKATERRAKGESIDNIFGFTEFYGLRFDVNKKVLTPRMETEILVEQVLKAEKIFKNATILDVGTGSGAIAVAIAKNCDANVSALDISKNALAVAENNAKKNGVNVEFLHSNLFDGLKRRRKFDIIVSNPPYIPTNDIEKLDKNVKDCDPHIALDGGEDGLDFYRKIIAQAPERLNVDGMLFFEVGKGQARAVKKLMLANGFEDIKIVKDYNKIERVVYGKRK